MKNFPHQINDLAKFHRALSIVEELIDTDQDVTDDSVVGEAMVLQGLYEFRDKSIPIEEALRRERAKSKGSQGTRAFARDLRRFFYLCRFIEVDLAGDLKMSALGRHLCSVGALTPAAKQVWRTALRQLTLGDGDAISHPYQVLLRLVENRPGLQAPRLALALEANDDSEEEYGRILQLADRSNWSEVLAEIGVSEHGARNATKILPALARQLGDLRKDGTAYYAGGLAEGLPQEAGVPAHVPRPARRHRRVSPTEIATLPTSREPPSPADEDYAPPWESARKRRQRLERHQRIVQTVARHLDARGFELNEDPYDILATKQGEPALLFEVKTLSEGGNDEVARVRAAIGQLIYYDFFEVPAGMRAEGLLKIVLFETLVSEEHITLFESLGIIAIWMRNGDFELTDWSMAQLEQTSFFKND